MYSSLSWIIATRWEGQASKGTQEGEKRSGRGRGRIQRKAEGW